jgi:hypothetical protein
MMIIHPTSLAATVDAVAETFFYQKPIPIPVREDIALIFTHRQCQTGSNAGFFIPFAAEMDTHLGLFSGKKIRTSFARNHILLIEATRMLTLLSLDDLAVAHSIQSAPHRMSMMCYSKFCPKGECKALTIAFLRLLALNGNEDSEPSINAFLTLLAGYRDGKGKWNDFPLFYTLLMLTELDNPLADHELQYSAPLCEKQQAQEWLADPISKRRQAIIAKALARS